MKKIFFGFTLLISLVSLIVLPSYSNNENISSTVVEEDLSVESNAGVQPTATQMTNPNDKLLLNIYDISRTQFTFRQSIGTGWYYNNGHYWDPALQPEHTTTLRTDITMNGQAVHMDLDTCTWKADRPNDPTLCSLWQPTSWGRTIFTFNYPSGITPQAGEAIYVNIWLTDATQAGATIGQISPTNTVLFYFPGFTAAPTLSQNTATTLSFNLQFSNMVNKYTTYLASGNKGYYNIFDRTTGQSIYGANQVILYNTSGYSAVTAEIPTKHTYQMVANSWSSDELNYGCNDARNLCSSEVTLDPNQSLSNIQWVSSTMDSITISWSWTSSIDATIYYRAKPLYGPGVSAGEISGSFSSAMAQTNTISGLTQATHYRIDISTSSTFEDYITLGPNLNSGIKTESAISSDPAATTVIANPYGLTASVNWGDVDSGTLYWQIIQDDTPSITQTGSLVASTGINDITISNLKPNTSYTLNVSSMDPMFSDSIYWNTGEARVEIKITTPDGISSVDVVETSQSSLKFTMVSEYLGTDSNFPNFAWKVVYPSGTTVIDPNTGLPMEGELAYNATPGYVYELPGYPVGGLMPNTTYELRVTDKLVSPGVWNWSGYKSDSFTTLPGLNSLTFDDSQTSSSDATFTLNWSITQPNTTIYYQIKDLTNSTTIVTSTAVTPTTIQPAYTMTISQLTNGSVDLAPTTTYELSFSLDPAFPNASGITVKDTFNTKKFLKQQGTITTTTTGATVGFITEKSSTDQVITATLENTTSGTAGAGNDPDELAPAPVTVAAGTAGGQFVINPGQLIPGSTYTLTLSTSNPQEPPLEIAGIQTKKGINNTIQTQTKDSTTATVQYQWEGPTSGSEAQIWYEVIDTATSTKVTSGIINPTSTTGTFVISGLDWESSYTVNYYYKDPVIDSTAKYAETTAISTAKGITNLILLGKTKNTATIGFTNDVTTPVTATYTLTETGGVESAPYNLSITPGQTKFTVEGLTESTEYTLKLTMGGVNSTVQTITFKTLVATDMEITNSGVTPNDYYFSYSWDTTATPIPFYFVVNNFDSMGGGTGSEVTRGTWTPSGAAEETKYLSQLAPGINLIPGNSYQIFIYTDAAGAEEMYNEVFTTSSRISDPNLVSKTATSLTISYNWINNNNVEGSNPHYSIDGGNTWNQITDAMIVDSNTSAVKDGVNTFKITGLEKDKQYDVMFSNSLTPIAPAAQLETVFTSEDYVLTEQGVSSSWSATNTMEISFYLDEGYTSSMGENVYLYITDNSIMSPVPPTTASVDTQKDNPADIENTMLDQWYNITANSNPNIQVNSDNVLLPGQLNTITVKNINQSYNYKFIVVSGTSYNQAAPEWQSISGKPLPPLFPTALVTISSVLGVTVIGAAGAVIYKGKKDKSFR